MGRGWSTPAWWLAAGVLAALGVAAGPMSPRRSLGVCGSASCTDCHDLTAGLSHPIDVAPSMDVPGHLPLTRGRLTCVTCHDVTAVRSVARLRGAMTRVSADWCGQCHDARSVTAADIHALAMPRAHYAAPARSTRRRAAEGEAGPDGESTTCLGCHDGNLASSGSIRVGRGPRFDGSTLSGDHPIGVPQRPRGAGDHLVWPNQVDASIRLYDGRVGCGSCHSPYSSEPDLLVMSNERSQLCLTCHDF